MKTTALALGGLLAFCGCSSDTPSAPPPTSTASPPPPSASPVQAAQRKPQVAPKRKPATAEKSAPDIPPDALMVGGSQPNYLVVAFAETSAENQRWIVPPPIGLDSRFMFVESPAVPTDSVSPVALPEGFTRVPSVGLTSEGRPLRIRCEKDGSEMVWIPPGPFLQGTDSGPPEAGPRHAIDLDGYYIDVHEVTVAQWQKYRDSAKDEKRATPQVPLNANGSSMQPALGISWRQADLYARWVGKQLPTEAQWEKAARGDKAFAYPWGDGRAIWDSARDVGQISDVGSFDVDRSIYGVMDLAGNAREWCSDWYADDAYRQLAASAGVAIRNWPGPKASDKLNRRVVKGGRDGWEVWRREGVSLRDNPPDVGLRCVLHIGASSVPAVETNAETTDPPPTRTPPDAARRPPVREPAAGSKKTPPKPAF